VCEKPLSLEGCLGIRVAFNRLFAPNATVVTNVLCKKRMMCGDSSLIYFALSMLPFEFTVEGPPVSHQTHNRVRLQEWREFVANAARNRWPPGEHPVDEQIRIVVTYYHDGPAIRMDNDNLVKPIQDALNGLVYVDDQLISDTVIRKTDLNGEFRVKGMSAVLAQGFIVGREFLHVRIESAPHHGDLL
jgi:crossover junction endodeoxyribonuclease RusA